jgi:hypothetical protein
VTKKIPADPDGLKTLALGVVNSCAVQGWLSSDIAFPAMMERYSVEISVDKWKTAFHAFCVHRSMVDFDGI